MKKGILFFLSLLLLANVNRLQAQFSGGKGTAEDPFQITNASELNDMRLFLGKCFILMNEIDLRDFTGSWQENPAGWVPIGKTHPFRGVFDGNKYAIKGLYMSGSNLLYPSLFGSSEGATIKNLCVETVGEGVSNTGAYYMAILVAESVGGNITNCHVKGRISGIADASAGGIAGVTAGTHVSYCSADVYLYDDIAGGLIGEVYRGTIEKCCAEGIISGRTSVGGLIGLAQSATVTQCYSAMQCSNGVHGGFIGNGNGNTVNSCYFDNELYNGKENWGIGKPSFEMKSPEAYMLWDFTIDWYLGVDLSCYPILRTRLEFKDDSEPQIFEFSYDSRGNRILRRIIVLNPGNGVQQTKSALAKGSTTNADNAGYEKPFIDSKAEMQIKIYPNPTQGKFKVEIQTSGTIDAAELELTSFDGKTILKRSGLGGGTEIDISAQPSGIYLMQLLVNGKKSHWKIIKQ